MHASSLDEVAVAQQIDYVPRRGFSSGVVSASRTCHSRSGIPLAIPPLFLSPTLSLSPLQKLQRVSPRSAKHSIIKSTPVLPYAARKGGLEEAEGGRY